MKKPDLLVLIAVWEFLTSLMSIVGLGAIIVVGLQTRTWWMRQNVDFDLYSPWIHFGLIVGGVICLIYAVLALAAGIGLLSGKEYGRIMSLIHGGFSLLVFPVGTVIGVLQIVYLTRSDVRAYFQ
ncbi:hypothetical protein Dform_01195 [Dehalogenimonas formicexedens]|uniref:Uncharacterized protein n=1 Tax=Dehalogenimonas formicexedens TaxID=1839801 RepID=A0A1P8F7T2_9CHLR|nr:hypothetical protein [Dehalogenimonas formicexedens]APV44527.1 hypothetical protein Dform_01195 [Dehalogenimonas formicexedens]